MGVEKYQNGFDLTVHESVLEEPLTMEETADRVRELDERPVPRIPAAFIESVFRVMNRASQHTFQVLTKRPARVTQLDPGLIWTPNIWMGTSIESKEWLDRLAKLKEANALTKFLSLEPLLGPLPGLDLAGIDWVIVGGESGPGARPMKADWVREIRDNCLRSGVPFFFKQWGGVFKKQTGRVLDNKTWDQMPDFKTI